MTVLIFASAVCAAAISPPANHPTSTGSSEILFPGPESLSDSPGRPIVSPHRHTAGGRTGPPGEFHNLKVLPKNISSKILQGMMVDEFEDALGVGCGFCHSEKKDSHQLDYASDSKPEKNIARSMMEMTIGLNRKYFLVRRPMIGDQAMVITCNTCHHGQPRPDTGGNE